MLVLKTRPPVGDGSRGQSIEERPADALAPMLRRDERNLSQAVFGRRSSITKVAAATGRSPIA